jgi:release factor glutamine methyltransferase
LPSAPSPYQQTLNINEALKAGSSRLQRVSESAHFDAQVLLAHIFNVERAWLLAHSEEALNQAQQKQWEASLARIEGGEALPYVLGVWEFYGLAFCITKDVLIPRPETELLVEVAIDWLAAHPGKRSAVDVGTGSGCIALSMAVNVPDLEITASDISEKALLVAARNIEHHKVGELVLLVQSDLLEKISGPIDLICANLPYIPSQRLSKLAVAKREPLLALDGGEDGLDQIRSFLYQASAKLASGGLLLAEIDDSHQESARAVASKCFPKGKISVRKDLAGRTRLLQVEA